MVEDADDRGLPAMNVIPDQQGDLGIRECRVVDHALYRLSDIELTILFGPGVNVMQSLVAVGYLQRLLRHHRENVRNVMAVQLVKLDRCRRDRVGDAEWQS